MALATSSRVSSAYPGGELSCQLKPQASPVAIQRLSRANTSGANGMLGLVNPPCISGRHVGTEVVTTGGRLSGDS